MANSLTFYASWTKGIAEDLTALQFIKNSQLIEGIELCNLNDDIEKICSAGVPISVHTPGMSKTANFCRDDFNEMLKGQVGQRVVEVCHMGTAPIIGFHLGYSASSMIKMAGFPNQPISGTEIHNREDLKELLVKNIIKCEKAINDNDLTNKNIVLETMDYCRSTEIDWGIQLPEAVKNKDIIESNLIKYGQNGALKWVTDSDFVSELMSAVNKYSIKHIGFLFDIAHNYISWESKYKKGEIQINWEDYVIQMLEAVDGNVLQIHINSPGGDDLKGYTDSHKCLNYDDALSENILKAAKQVIDNSKSIKVITLEMRTWKEPQDHVKILEEQAELVLHHINN